MTSKELRQKYLEFFKRKGHAIIPSASLIPENDPTVLFTTAGMHPLVPFLMGEKHPAGTRLVNVQKCIRLQDIEEVGDKTHDTFFEMLGNWSLGDYFKKEAIEWSWEFLTGKEWIGFDPKKLYVSVFEGDQDAPLDEESIKHWQAQFKKAGIAAAVYDPKKSDNSQARIFPLGKKDNWWGPAGKTGPCGPDTEMFYYMGEGNLDFAKERLGYNDDNFVEIWNDVFMQYNKKADGSFEPLKQQNVDTGMGLERMLMILQGKDNIFETDVFLPIIRKIEQVSGKKYGQDEGTTKAIRVITDHVRTAVFILGDDAGIKPSNVEHGYVLRRLIRRAVRYGRRLDIKDHFTHLIAQVVIDLMGDVYNELKKNQNFIIEQSVKEEEKFAKTLEKGLKQFERIASQTSARQINSRDAFYLYESFGFPLEITAELAKEKGLRVDEQGFQKEFAKHQELSRLGAQQKFAGGLADHSQKTTAYHTATHLLHQALREVLGEHAAQRGSNITEQRLRFDFSHGEKMTPEQIKRVEEIVNKKIQENLPVICEEMTVAEAKAKGAIGLFETKYGDKVKMYTIGSSSASSESPFSREICGGPHVKNTGELGRFKIIKEEASSAGVRRIKAVLE